MVSDADFNRMTDPEPYPGAAMQEKARDIIARRVAILLGYGFGIEPTLEPRDYAFADGVMNDLADAGLFITPVTPTATADAVLSIIPAPVTPTWRCTCTGQGGETYPQDCPLHDRSVNTEDPAWRKRYVDHLDKQVQIAKRLGWTPLTTPDNDGRVMP